MCRSKPDCGLCGEKHQTLIHDSAIQSFKVNAVKDNGRCKNVNLSVLPVSVYHEDTPSAAITVYALLDPCIQGTFILESALPSLGLKDLHLSNVIIKTLNGNQKMQTAKIKGLVVSTVQGVDRVRIKLPTAYTQAIMPFDSEDIISRAEI